MSERELDEGGAYLAFTYVHWRETSLRTAFWMTAGLHAAHNLVAFAIEVAPRVGG